MEVRVDIRRTKRRVMIKIHCLMVSKNPSKNYFKKYQDNQSLLLRWMQARGVKEQSSCMLPTVATGTDKNAVIIGTKVLKNYGQTDLAKRSGF